MAHRELDSGGWREMMADQDKGLNMSEPMQGRHRINSEHRQEMKLRIQPISEMFTEHLPRAGHCCRCLGYGKDKTNIPVLWDLHARGEKTDINKSIVNDMRWCEAYTEKPSPETDSECWGRGTRGYKSMGPKAQTVLSIKLRHLNLSSKEIFWGKNACKRLSSKHLWSEVSH